MQGATARWHSRQRWHRSICNLQILKDRTGFESHPLRQPSPSARYARGSGWHAASLSVREGCPPKPMSVANVLGEGGLRVSDLPPQIARYARGSGWLRRVLRACCEGCPPRSQRAQRALLAKGAAAYCDAGRDFRTSRQSLATLAAPDGFAAFFERPAKDAPPVANERSERFWRRRAALLATPVASSQPVIASCRTGPRVFPRIPVESFGAEFAHELGCSTQPSDSSTSSRA